VRQAEGDGGVPREGVHRGDIAHVYADRLRAEVAHRGKAAVEVDRLDERVRRDDMHAARADTVNGGVIPDPLE
jgi:hypothetical protein